MTLRYPVAGTAHRHRSDSETVKKKTSPSLSRSFCSRARTRTRQPLRTTPGALRSPVGTTIDSCSSLKQQGQALTTGPEKSPIALQPSPPFSTATGKADPTGTYTAMSQRHMRRSSSQKGPGAGSTGLRKSADEATKKAKRVTPVNPASQVTSENPELGEEEARINRDEE
nr:uncharacterized protein LOC129384841 [Dermacentor andersoni]